MDLLDDTGSDKHYRLWGLVLSLVLHGLVIVLALFWGFNVQEYQGPPQSIQVVLTSPEEIGGTTKREFPAQVSKKEDKDADIVKSDVEKVKKVEKEEAKEIPKPREEPKVEVPKKQEPKKKEEPKVAKVKEKPVKKEEPVKKLEKQNKEVKKVELKEPKKEVARVEPKATASVKQTEAKRVPDEGEKKPKADFEKERERVFQEIKKALVLKDIKRRVEGEEEDVFGGGDTSEGRGGTVSGKDLGSGTRATIAALFINRLREEIRSNWKVPESIPLDGTLETKVVFKIDENGVVRDVRVEKSSGNPAFDEFCVKAIYRASPLKTPVPPELLEEAKNEGIEVSFRNS
ncbi:MAG: hypothetical protein KatS3mg078_0666 [Deltaproteobacteria bacterium]|jgi:colicin import membrane protein|nr:MAG: hypothetical protein KatS3mg078_0666 [Deltaproteobacteria bacterium]